jgi:hypothetical protein
LPWSSDQDQGRHPMTVRSRDNMLGLNRTASRNGDARLQWRPGRRSSLHCNLRPPQRSTIQRTRPQSLAVPPSILLRSVRSGTWAARRTSAMKTFTTTIIRQGAACRASMGPSLVGDGNSPFILFFFLIQIRFNGAVARRRRKPVQIHAPRNRRRCFNGAVARRRRKHAEQEPRIERDHSASMGPSLVGDGNARGEFVR